MSTLKVESIQHPSSSTPAISLDSNGAMTGSFPAPNRNILYNGAMQVSQRGTSVTGNTAGGYLTADRWHVEITSLGTWTQTIENDSPTGSGLRRSLKMLCTTADAAPAGGDYLIVQQKLEGQDLQRIAKGTASAQQLTLSFWVKSNVTGTYIANLTDADNSSRFNSQSYTISASATWEQKSVTFVADTSGAFDNDNALSLYVRFFLGAGTNFTSGSLQSASWGTTAANYAVGQTNLAAATNNYWQITGVQLETGPVATEFEFKSFGRELAECQRYYYKANAGGVYSRLTAAGSSYNTSSGSSNVIFPVSMRTTPTALTTANVRVEDGASGFSISTPTLGSTASGTEIGVLDWTGASGLIAYRPYWVSANNNSSAYVAFSAEL